MDVTGRTVLIAGGASGLGLATARRLRAEGARVVAADLPGSIARTAATPDAEGIEFAAADVTDEQAVADAVTLANSRGDLSVVVNCAGIGDPQLTVSKTGPQDLARFERVVRVNLIGTFNVVRLAAAAMMANDRAGEERGVIVNTASAAAFDGQIGQASYAASKAGIAGMTLPLARELARHAIRVVTIAPGLFDTPLLGQLPDETRAALGAQVPFPSRLGRPEEYADLVAAVTANPMLNGETIRLDGSIRMAPR
ncbi:SDR family NAD(P)-dependent oxidoreductase [Microbacterium thalassium]|uniref:NAD(P)-dependent dehydrogenase (Short-subunit alcohol dehydrogenase family) n=1 Tax=Microbacterium thalassium TaxID=362649 RepID=A0A7X0KTV8_9MICO|nr:SDR family NAD(P)-dependent oxidoreductase [Microbacterium thalassium]MBB6390512.1 NAD(P)-dependent dehydrogenase (short-subunit alcohol dehydrogenase family) [Microbacterium thalassium]GLK25623.1 3-hydroxyacyl-CoA dehydrogenase [Microbacterium thalassium]